MNVFALRQSWFEGFGGTLSPKLPLSAFPIPLVEWTSLCVTIFFVETLTLPFQQCFFIILQVLVKGVEKEIFHAFMLK